MAEEQDAEKDGSAAAGKILDQPAEGDPATIDRELRREDKDKDATEKDKVVHDRVKTAMDEAAPQTGVRPGP